MPKERLQKLLARAGLGSRRACERLIREGRVRVNGRVARLGERADPERDRITVDGKPLPPPERLLYIKLYKPRGVISTVRNPHEHRRTVTDLVPRRERLYPVGRLDADSEGLILLTNDGELAYRLTHPRYGHEKEYRVLVRGRPTAEQLKAWRAGVILPDGHRTAPAQVEVESRVTTSEGERTWLRVILREGRKRQLRQVGKLLGLPVLRLIRVRIGSLELGDLRPGEWRHLTPEEVAALRGGSGRGRGRSR